MPGACLCFFLQRASHCVELSQNLRSEQDKSRHTDNRNQCKNQTILNHPLASFILQNRSDHFQHCNMPPLFLIYLDLPRLFSDSIVASRRGSSIVRRSYLF